MERGDRDSTTDWLVPEEPDGEISVERAASQAPPVSLLERFEAAESRLRRTEAMLRLDQDAGHAAIEAAAAAERSATVAERAGAVSLAAQREVAELTERVDAALEILAAREAAAQNRAAEAQQEADAIVAFRVRADRIVETLRRLEADAANAGTVHVTATAQRAA